VAAGRARGSRPRRVSLPGVAELLRPVGPGPASDPGRQASGREAHPQKITVYLSADEFLDLERARLTLRIHGIGVDRGRLVREAIAVLIADLEAGIDVSVIARRLRAAAQPDLSDGMPGRPALANSGPGNGGPLTSDGPIGGAVANGGLAGGDLVGSGLVGSGPVSAALASGGLANSGQAYTGHAHGGPAGGGLVTGTVGGAPPGAQ
jgi:hypothetical protein